MGAITACVSWSGGLENASELDGDNEVRLVDADERIVDEDGFCRFGEHMVLPR